MAHVPALLTVTLHVAVLPLPSAAVAVMLAVPAATGVTTPAVLTVATEVLLDDHVTFLLQAPDGVAVAVSVEVLPPQVSDSVLLLSDSEVTLVSCTVTEQVAVLSSVVASVPLVAVAVMVAVPALTAVTTPALLTVATEVLLDDHVTVLLDASDGDTVAVIVCVPVGQVKVLLVGLSDTPVTSTVPPGTVIKTSSMMKRFLLLANVTVVEDVQLEMVQVNVVAPDQFTAPEVLVVLYVLPLIVVLPDIVPPPETVTFKFPPSVFQHAAWKVNVTVFPLAVAPNVLVVMLPDFLLVPNLAEPKCWYT